VNKIEYILINFNNLNLNLEISGDLHLFQRNLDKKAMKSVEEKSTPIMVLNYGCSANRAIAEGMMGTLQRKGFLLTESVDEAKTVIVNTCIVKQNTEHRMKSQLLLLSKTKNIVVTGCLPVVMREWVLKNVPKAKILFPEVANQVGNLLQDQPVEEVKIDDPANWSQLYSNGRNLFNPVVTITEVSRGCLGNCSFCIVKDAKGKLRSRSPELIISEIKTALKNGCKEIWLTSQDIGTFGWDFSPKLTISFLVDSIVTLEGDYFIRLGMMTPFTLKKFLDPLIHQLNSSKVFTFLHLPIQSGSDAILRSMRRKETRKYFIDLIKKLRGEVDELVLATDIIVGFPGESEEDFIETKTLLQEVKPEIVNISKYTDRFGTLASKMSGKISTKIKSNRSKELSKLTRRIGINKLEKWIGWEGTILIDEFGKKKNQFVGRNSSYLPVVVTHKDISLGKFTKTRIIQAAPTYLVGERI
jgi:MiaB-like tRNA modifying enzyme